MIGTPAVLCLSWSLLGQWTRPSSTRMSWTNLLAPPRRLLFCCVFLAPFVAAEPRFLPIASSPGSLRRSRAGGTRTPDLRFWRPLLYQLSYCPLLNVLASLPVRRVVPAPRAELPQLDTIRGVAPVLTGVVVPALALLASQRYQLSHNLPPNHRGGTRPAPSLSVPFFYSSITPVSGLLPQPRRSCHPHVWRSSSPRPWLSGRSTPPPSPCCPQA